MIRLAILTKKYFYERGVFPFFESRDLFKHARPLRHETKLFEKKINLKQNLSRVVCNKTTNFAKGVKFSVLISSLALTNRQNNWMMIGGALDVLSYCDSTQTGSYKWAPDRTYCQLYSLIALLRRVKQLNDHGLRELSRRYHIVIPHKQEPINELLTELIVRRVMFLDCSQMDKLNCGRMLCKGRVLTWCVTIMDHNDSSVKR